MKTAIKGIDFTDSWVLGWKEQAGLLEFSVEFSIWPESAYYIEPNRSEYTCYRMGILIFEGVTAVSGLKNEEAVRFSTDPDGSKDFGNIESFTEQKGSVHLSGDFGDVLVECSSWSIEIK